MIPSPIADSFKSQFIESISADFIIKKYKRELDLDTERFFEGISKVEVRKCVETGYRFYYPPNILADGAFYQELNEGRSYYHSWNWEQKLAAKYIKDGDKVLDLGCGEGAFLAHLKKIREVEELGLDISESAVKAAQDQKLHAVCKRPEELTESHHQQFDVITAFQVLEHIYDIKSFIETCNALLKPGGILIISVPNNAPYYDTFDQYHTLNLPPHHMGLWDSRSLKAIASVYEMTQILEKTQEVDSFKRKLKMKYSISNKRGTLFFIKLLPAFLIKLYFQFKHHDYKGAGILSVYKAAG